MRILSFVAICLVLAFAFVPGAAADIVFDNTAGGLHAVFKTGSAEFSSQGNYAKRVAFQFTVSGGTYALDGVGVAIVLVGDDHSALKLSITDDNSGEPGNVLEVLSDGQTGWITTRTLVNLASTSHPVLEDGKKYWIVAEPTKSGVTSYSYDWVQTNSGTSLPFIQQTLNDAGVAFSSWTGNTYSDSDRGGLKIQGTKLLALGTVCTKDADCVSNHCADGVCCDTACGGSDPNDCMACRSDAGSGGSDGTCSALTAVKAPMVECRAAQGACDAPEYCSTGSMECPASKVDACEPNGNGTDGGVDGGVDGGMAGGDDGGMVSTDPDGGPGDPESTKESSGDGCAITHDQDGTPAALLMMLVGLVLATRRVRSRQRP
ncbi:MAG: hypothetical protein KC416_14705 [Myxococcales bacterium]|nr:hypothetical protein [Myxococcales bacterium]